MFEMTNNENCVPAIIKRIEQTELNEVSNLLGSCHVLPVALVKAFLKKRERTDNQVENIINQLVKRKLAFYDDSKTYLKLNKAYSTADLSQGYVKSIWLLMDLIKNIEEYFVQTKSPHTMTFFNATANKDGENPVYDVFYIPYGTEKLNEYIINNMPVYSEDPLNCFIIIESEEQIKQLNFSNKINVVSYVLVSSVGEIDYIR